ncbi:ATP-dependent helicase [Candidatus Binatus sp.]|uniref:ATP-dependent helicase n=1 Tax=Candidatus Binatus sp. TaxID=2811406 RepID=UPI003BED4601
MAPPGSFEAATVTVKLDDLNPEQRAAVLAPDGPILILAGAGSGKTRVLTYRIAHILAERKASPAEVLAVTFTNKATKEMRERVISLLGDDNYARQPWVSTFHSACARILRQEGHALGYDRNFSILDEGDSMTTIRRVLDDAALADSPPLELARARIEQAKNEAVTPDEMLASAKPGREASIAQIYRLYQQRMHEMNAMDFSDLQLQTWLLFERFPEILEKWQRRAAHLLVDEYQDTNRVQYLIVQALAARSGNLCVVGDEDQSIYRWRGADIRNILDFERDYPAAQIFKLEQNYRSTKTILAAAGAVIRNNTERKVKNLWTENGAGEPVTYYTGATERDEADFIALEIARLTGAGGFRAAEVVVFYRVNAQSRAIEEALVRRRIPYYVVGGVRFYEQRDVKDLLAYLRVIANPADAVSLERMVGTPPRGIGAKSFEAIVELAARERIPAFEAMGRLETYSKVALRIAKQAGMLYSWMHDLRERAPDSSVRGIVEEVVAHSGFEPYLDTLDDAPARKQNLAEMLSAASAFDAEKSGGGLSEFLERVALVSDTEQIDSSGGRAALMTLHTSKGLEYPIVFMAGMEEGLFPHSRSADLDEEVEEERRLCYVGMTRARQLLYLTNTLSREIYGVRQESRQSRFLREVDPALIRRIAPARETAPIRPLSPRETYVDLADSQLPDDEPGPGGGNGSLSIGARVIHPTFGRGIVQRREGRGDGAKAWVNFERGGIKLLVLKFANLRLLGD